METKYYGKSAIWVKIWGSASESSRKTMENHCDSWENKSTFPKKVVLSPTPIILYQAKKLFAYLAYIECKRMIPNYHVRVENYAFFPDVLLYHRILHLSRSHAEMDLVIFWKINKRGPFYYGIVFNQIDPPWADNDEKFESSGLSNMHLTTIAGGEAFRFDVCVSSSSSDDEPL